MAMLDAGVVADNVRRSRERRGLSRDTMAAALGVDDRTVAWWESGTERIAPQFLYRISLFLGVRLSALFSVDQAVAVEASPPDPVALDRLPHDGSSTLQAARETRGRVSASAARMLASAAALSAAIAETQAALTRLRGPLLRLEAGAATGRTGGG